MLDLQQNDIGRETMMNTLELDAFKYEIRNWNNIPLGSQNCGVNCLFCKINADPILKRFPRIPAITLDELYLGFQEVNRDYPYVRLGAGVIVAPHTDPFVHPEIYSFIQHTARYFPDQTVSTVTTASYLELFRIDELNRISNFGIDLSLITMQPSRETLIPYSTREKLNVVLREAPVRKISLMFTGSVDDLYRDLELLHSLELHNKCREILVRRIEHTSLSPTILKKISFASICGYEKLVEMLQKDFPNVLYTLPSLDSCYYKSGYDYFTTAESNIAEISTIAHANNHNKHYVITADGSYQYFRCKLSALHNVEVIRVPNQTYGGSITVNGLLTNQDIFSVMDSIDPIGEVIMVSKHMYDRDNRDILGDCASDIENRYHARLIIL